MECPICSCEAVDLTKDAGASATALEREGTCYSSPAGVSGYCWLLDKRRDTSLPEGHRFTGHYGSKSQVRRLKVQAKL